ncbi:MAG: IS91 family transposase [Burkholderiaceae bacterium]
MIRRHGAELLKQRAITAREQCILKCLASCRTAELGGHVAICDHCSHRHVVYNSCRNRHCPKCQAGARAAWLEARRDELLPVEYFHVVFTLPDSMSRIAWQNKRVVYDILFRAAADTLLEVAADPKHLGGQLGFLGVLHTWGQNLLHHPHVHFVVPGGGISPDGSQWQKCPAGFFLPVRVLSRVFRGKFLALLREAYHQGRLAFRGEQAPAGTAHGFKRIVADAYRVEWVVYAKPPFGGPEQVLKYLARYTHRVAISNDRLLKLEEGQVTFRWKNYADHSKTQTMTVSALEFLRRFLLHVLPRGFMRIRHYGFLANRHRQAQLALCRRLLAVSPPAAESADLQDAGEASTRADDSAPRCPKCAIGSLIVEQTWNRPSMTELLLNTPFDSS